MDALAVKGSPPGEGGALLCPCGSSNAGWAQAVADTEWAVRCWLSPSEMTVCPLICASPIEHTEVLSLEGTPAAGQRRGRAVHL